MSVDMGEHYLQITMYNWRLTVM